MNESKAAHGATRFCPISVCFLKDTIIWPVSFKKAKVFKDLKENGLYIQVRTKSIVFSYQNLRILVEKYVTLSCTSLILLRFWIQIQPCHVTVCVCVCVCVCVYIFIF
jgi:hypothetical protein